MFPYKDDNPTNLTPIVTIATIVITSAIWLIVQGAGTEPLLSNSVCELGAIASRVFQRVPHAIMSPEGPIIPCPDASGFALHTVFTSVFLHGGWFHLAGNMWFLWVFGNNIEDSMGHVRFVIFYLVCGSLAALAQMVVDPSSPIPLVGASGAISGIMGAYLVLFPKVRVHTLVWLGIIFLRVQVPAYFMLLYWAFLQFVGSLPSMGGNSTGGVAFLAHLGGFVVGAALVKLFAKPDLLAAHTSGYSIPSMSDYQDRYWR